MKEVIVHIGAHKTGTTTIQKSLHGYDDGRTKYARFPQSNHSIPMRSIFQEMFDQKYHWKQLGWTKQELEKYQRTNRDILHAGLRDNKTERLIISGEGICHLSYDEKRSMIKEIHAVGAKTRIIYFARDPNNSVVSVMQQRAKEGRSVHLAVRPNFKAEVGDFLDLLPAENIHVCDFNAVVKSHDLLEFFGNLIGIKLPKISSKNTSLSAQGLALINIVNNLPFSTTRNPALLSARHKLVSRIMNTFSIAAGYDKIDPKIFTTLLSDDTKDQCDWLKDKFRIAYSVPINRSHQLSIDDYLENSLKNHDTQIAKIFRKLDLELSPQKNLQENIMNAFLDLLIRGAASKHNTTLLVRSRQKIQKILQNHGGIIGQKIIEWRNR